MPRNEVSKNQNVFAHSPERVSPFQINHEQTKTIVGQEPILSSSLDEKTKTASTTTSPPISIPTSVLNNSSIPPFGTESPSFARPRTEQIAAESDSITDTISWQEWALTIWTGGFLLLSFRIARRSILFRHRLRFAIPLQNPELLQSAENAKKKLGIKSNTPIHQTDCVSSPAVYGLFSPKILLPKHFRDSYSDVELSHVLSHELAHIKRRDSIWNLWSTLVQLVHWPNPLVWYSTTRMRSDRELATDYLTLNRCTETAPLPYGETILKTLRTIPTQRIDTELIGFSEDRSSLVRRFDMISRFQRGRSHSKWVTAIVGSLLGLTSLTDPTGPGKSILQAALHPGKTINVLVTDRLTKQPLPGIIITTVFGPRIGDESRETATATTNEKGLASLKLINPPGPEIWLAMNAIPRKGYVSQLRYWRSDQGIWDQLPVHHEFQLERGVEIGGTIVDERQTPLANVGIEISGTSRKSRGDPNKKNMSRLFAPFELGIETDIQGKWTCSVAPESATSIQLLLRKPNGVTHQCATPSQLRGLNSRRNGSPIFTSELQEKTSRIIFPAGKRIEITVTDENGIPLADANLQELTGTTFRKLGWIEVTDQSGIARFDDRIGHEIGYIVTHPNYATTSQVMTPLDDETSATIRLLPKKRLEGTIRDRSGKPIANALVSLDTETNESLYLNWSVRSGPQGQFHWDNAPLSNSFYQIRADGFETQVIESKPTDGPIRVILDNPIRAVATHTAYVVDADTGRPIRDFSYLRGRDFPSNFLTPTKGSEGKIVYTAPPEEIVDLKKPIQGEHYRIEIRAPGYKNTMSRAINIYESNADIQIKLQPNPKKHSLRDVVVLSPSGAPVGGAFVQLVGNDIKTISRISNQIRSRSRPTGRDSSFLISNAEGKLPAAALPLGFRGIAITDDRGSITIAATDLDLSDGKIQLLSLGKLEGILRVNGLPKGGLRVDLRVAPEEELLFDGSIYTTTNKEGRFVFDRIPLGTYRLFRSNTAINSFVSPEYYPQNTKIQPGKTTVVDYLLEGQAILGRFVTDPPRNNIDWQKADPWWMEGNYILRKITKGVEPPLLPPRRDQYVTNDRYIRSNNRYRRQFKATSKLNSYTYPLDVTPEGQFSAASVPPGEYILEAKLVEMLGIERGTIRKRTLGTLSRKITIPDGSRESALNIGTITIPIISSD
ncbi:M56 family metallopeptidase [Verrucomicrobia bacterium]|nr:M56 family metallopeptidase [Verrucomicrobiota bacterium]